jgi:hypothetical protein
MTWFRPKTYGYGATPSSWQGWLAVAAFLAVEVGLAWAILGFDEDAGQGGSSPSWRSAPFSFSASCASPSPGPAANGAGAGVRNSLVRIREPPHGP